MYPYASRCDSCVQLQQYWVATMRGRLAAPIQIPCHIYLLLVCFDHVAWENGAYSGAPSNGWVEFSAMHTAGINLNQFAGGDR